MEKIDHTQPEDAYYNLPFSVSDFNGMPYRPLGASGLKVSNVGVGTWKFGYPEKGDGARVPEKTAFDILDRAITLGVTFWDTANRYNQSSGNSERIIGSWFRQHPSLRRQVVLATKIGGCMDGTTPNHCGLSRSNILDAVSASLERLQTDHIDLLYFHSYDPSTPPEESLAAVEDLVGQGCVRYFGVSNFSMDHLRAYTQDRLSMSVRSRIVAVQNRYDVLQGEAAEYAGVLEHARAGGYSFIAWSPLAKGWLTDRYTDRSKAAKGDRLFDEKLLDERAWLAAAPSLQALAGLANAWGITVSQLALAYMLAIPGMGPVIPSSSSVAQLESNAAAAHIRFTEQQLASIAGILRTKGNISI